LVVSGIIQVPNLHPEVLEVVGRVLLEDAIDFYGRAVRTAILEYRRCEILSNASMQSMPWYASEHLRKFELKSSDVILTDPENHLLVVSPPSFVTCCCLVPPDWTTWRREG
jgi:hypothetical protein